MPVLQGLFAMIQAQHPGQSSNGAAQTAALHNLDVYLLGKPLTFLHMLWNKAWNMWSYPWSGGNSVGGGGLSRTTSLFQHQVYSLIAWLGILVMLPSTLWLLRSRRRVISSSRSARSRPPAACTEWCSVYGYPKKASLPSSPSSARDAAASRGCSPKIR